ncbi:MAG: hypothetical protein JWQ56_1647 [Pseudarthrobacter sp.]|nr:hypothetical protein [Pseudarthrobacter sp.]
MRWPWQRERTGPPADSLRGGPTEPAAMASRVPPSGWAFLPPLQRTVENIQLTSDPGHFAGALASWNDPSFTGPMTHLVSAAAPPGFIDVDGGGPVSGNAGYSPSPVEMTLLPPPAPRIRTTPNRPGSAGSLQRTASDGGTPAGASLLASEPGAFPVLHVDAIPLQPPEPPSAADWPAASATPADPGTSEPPLSEAAGESFRASLPGQPGPPGYPGGSTSDGHATYVPLPPAPAVQRALSGTDGASKQYQHVPHPSKLGLGMPLSFSGPVTASEPSASNRPPHPAVQRSVAPVGSPGSTGPAPVQAPVEPPVQAPVEPLVQALDPEDDSAGQAALGPAELPPSPSPDGTAATLLSAAVAHEATDRGGPAATIEAPPGEAREASDTSRPNMPVVSRSVSAAGVTPEAVADRDGPDARLEPSGQLPSAGLTTAGFTSEKSGESAAVVQIDAADTATAPIDAAAEPGADSTPPPLVVTANGPAPADAGAVQRDLESGRPLIQRVAGPIDRGSPDGQMHAASQESAVILTLPSVPMQRAAGQAPPTIQRAAQQSVPIQPTQALTQPQGPALPTAVAPVVLRVVQTASPGTRPETWQRLTALPAAAQPVHAAPLPIPAPASSPGGRDTDGIDGAATLPGPAMNLISDSAAPPPMPVGVTRDAGTRANAGMEGDSGTHGDAGFHSDTRSGADFDMVPGPAAAVPAVDLLSAAPPRQSAAVGRSIQRTVAMGGLWSTADAGPGPLAPSNWSVEAVSPTNGAGTQSAGRGAGTIQRSEATSAVFPRHVELATARVASRRVGPAGTAGLAVLAGTPANDYSPPALVLSPAAQPADQATSAVAQREVTPFPPEVQSGASVAGPAPAAGLPTAAPDTAGFAASVQADAESAPAGAARQGPAASGNGRAGPEPQNPGTAAATPEQLEELAKRLTGPLIRRIKAEMLLDRERRGLRTDVN